MARRNFASGTSVPVSRSVGEARQVILRYGATGFMFGEEGTKTLLSFVMHGLQVRLAMSLPEIDDFMETPAGYKRAPAAAKKVWEQETRRRWRSLVLILKAKLEAVESEVVTFEEEFMAYLVAPDGKTMGEVILPQIEEARETGKMPSKMFLLPGRKKR